MQLGSAAVAAMGEFVEVVGVAEVVVELAEVVAYQELAS